MSQIFEVFEVVFVDKIIGRETRTIIEWTSLAVPNFNHIVKLANAKVRKYVGCKSTDLVLRSLRSV